MEQVFACNMQLMDDFNVTAAVQIAIEDIIIPETTKKILDTVINSDKTKGGLQNIIVILVKRQREMEDTLKTKMDRDSKEKSDCFKSIMNTMMEDIEIVDILSTKIDNQIDTLDLRQSRLVDKIKRLYKQSVKLKVEIFKLQIDINSIDDQIQNTKKNRSTHNVKSPGIESISHSQSSGAQGDDSFMAPICMPKHPINTTGGPSPILTPFQFLYLLGNHHVKEVESYKFQKAKLNVKCVDEDYVFTFYNTLQHIAASFNILLQPLKEITKTTGLCQLTKDNCIGYERAKDIISAVLHLKLTCTDYFRSFS